MFKHLKLVEGKNQGRFSCKILTIFFQVYNLKPHDES